MKKGASVLYVDSNGDEHRATVLELEPRGESGNRTLTLDVEGMGKREGVPHRVDGAGKRTYWTEAPAETGMTEGQRAAAARAAEPALRTRGADYVYGEGEPEPGPGDATTQDEGPGLGGGGGKDDGPGLGGGGGEEPPAEPETSSQGEPVTDAPQVERTTRNRR